MRRGPNIWLVAIVLVLIVVGVRLCSSSDGLGTFSDETLDEPSQASIEAAATHVERVVEAAGLTGAKQYSEVCYSSLSTAPQAAELDRCYAFDLLVGSLDFASAPAELTSWFTGNANRSRWITASAAIGLSNSQRDSRRDLIERAAASIDLSSIAVATPTPPSTQATQATPETITPTDPSVQTPSPDVATEDTRPNPPAAISNTEAKTDLSRSAQPDRQNRWQRRIIDSYPSSALRRGIEGTVGVFLVINAEGRVASCTVSSSSGAPMLDKAACDGLERYARFLPALNRYGSPTAGSWSTSVTYRLN